MNSDAGPAALCIIGNCEESRACDRALLTALQTRRGVSTGGADFTHPRGEARKVEGGYLVSGRKVFASQSTAGAANDLPPPRMACGEPGRSNPKSHTGASDPRHENCKTDDDKKHRNGSDAGLQRM